MQFSFKECGKGQHIEKIKWKYQGHLYGLIDFKMKCSNETSYRPPAIGNPHGEWNREMNCQEKGFKLLRGREGGWPGIVNVEARCVDGNEDLSSNDDLRGQYNRDLTCRVPGSSIVGVQVNKKTNHGIVNFRVLCG